MICLCNCLDVIDIFKNKTGVPGGPELVSGPPDIQELKIEEVFVII